MKCKCGWVGTRNELAVEFVQMPPYEEGGDYEEDNVFVCPSCGEEFEN